MSLTPEKRAERFREGMRERGEVYVNRVRVPRAVAECLRVDAQSRKPMGSVSSVAAEILARHYAVGEGQGEGG